MAEQIVGRRRELVALEEFLDAVPAGGSALLFEGDAGIGKTALWQEGARLARERGMRVLTARATHSELRTSLRDRRRPVRAGAGRDAAAARAGPAARARGRVPAPGARWAAAGGTAARGGAARRSCGSSSRTGRCSSRSTMRSGSMQARRRSSGSCFGGWRPSRSACWRRCAGGRSRRRSSSTAPSPEFRRLPVTPLSVGAIHRLLWGRLSLNLPRPVLVRVHEAVGGNPFFALEVGRALARRHDPRRRRARAPAREPSRPRRGAAERAAGAGARDARRRGRARRSLGHAAGAAGADRRRRHRAGLPAARARARRRPDPLHASPARTRLLRGHAAAPEAPAAPPPRRPGRRSGGARPPSRDRGRRPRRGDRSRARRGGGARAAAAAPPRPRPSSPSARSR